MAISEDIKPTSMAFNNTDRCQSRCITCCAWGTPASVMEKELTTDQWKDIIFKMHEWLGDFTFIFSGGEPFLRDDIFELAEYATNLGVTVNVVTNGLALTDKYEKVADSAFKIIVFSLNSVKNPSLHCESRGRKDSFKKTMDVIQNVNYLIKKKQNGKGISISTIIMPSNLSEVKPIAEFAKTEDIGVAFQLLDNGDAFLPPKDADLGSNLANDISDEFRAAIQMMIDLKQQGYPICNSFGQLEAFKALVKKPEELSVVEDNSTYDEVESQDNQSHSIEVQEAQTESLAKPEIEFHQESIENTESPSFAVEEDIQELAENSSVNVSFEVEVEQEVSEVCQDAIDFEQEAEVPAEVNKEPTNPSDFPCQVGYHNFAIDPYGNVRICFCLEPIGSLKDSSPSELWRSEKAEWLRDVISKCPKSCKLLNCNFKD